MKRAFCWNILTASLTLIPLAFAVDLPQTPMQTMGPFYPVVKPKERDWDLTQLKGHKGKAQGQVLYVTGRVLNREGKPVKGARVEIWQANAHGRYGHPSEHNKAALDPNFQGYGVVTTDAQGRYRFRTVKPAAYPAGDMVRAPHIHFQVTGKHDLLVTQMYFPGEPQNETDPIRKGDGGSLERLTAKMSPAVREPGALVAEFDIVLASG